MTIAAMKRVPCRQCPLRASPTFKPLPARTVAFINKMKIDHLSVDAGFEVQREGDPNPRLFTLFKGWAFRYKTLSDGRRQILNFLLPGDLIGVQGRMFDAAPHAVETLTRAELCVFARRHIWELYSNYPELAFDITWLTAHEEGMVDDNLLAVGRRNALERVAMLLIHLYKRSESLQLVEEGGLDLPISQQHIADALGLSLVHTNKTLRRLARMDLFRLERSRLILRNPRALQKLADYFETPLQPRPLL